MPSPFPGMDPYLERSDFWPAFHFRLIGAIAAAIEPQLSSQYYVEVETRTYQSQDSDEDLLIGIADAAVLSSRAPRAPAAPASTESTSTESTSIESMAVATQIAPERVMLPMLLPVQERYLEVRASKTNVVITVIEVLSPKNKRSGDGRDAYEKKRRTLLESPTHLVEVDLLRGGQVMPLRGLRSPTAYRILISRSDQRPGADLYRIALSQPLPTIPIPLKPGEPEPQVDFQVLLNQIYAEARYALRIEYGQPLPPPALTAEERQWVESILATMALPAVTDSGEE